jgi:hypothetical protein
MYVGRFLSAVSVGFIPLSYECSNDDASEWGIDFLTQELLECSCCPVPANPEALIAAKAADIDVTPIREWCAKHSLGWRVLSLRRPFARGCAARRLCQARRGDSSPRSPPVCGSARGSP